MGEVREVTTGRYLREGSARYGDGDGVVTVEDGADVALWEVSFGYAANGVIEGFHPFEFGQIAGVLTSAGADAQLLDRAGRRSNSYFDARAAVELGDYPGSLLRIVLESEIEADLDFAVIFVLKDRGCRGDGHGTGCCRR